MRPAGTGQRLPVRSRLGSVTRTRRGLLWISGTATALILWLSFSFWIDAWHQRRDASLLLEEVGLHDQLFDAARLVASERVATLCLFAAGAGDAATADRLRRTIATTRAALIARLDTLLANATTINGAAALALTPRQIETIANARAELKTARQGVDRELAEDTSRPDPAAGRTLYHALNALAEALLLVRDDARTYAHRGNATMSRLLELRRLSWTLGESVSRNTALLSALIDGHQGMDQDIRTHSLAATLDARRAWERIASLSAKANLDAHVQARVDTVATGYRDRFMPASERLLGPWGSDAPSVTLSSWTESSRETRDAIARLDDAISERASNQLTDIAAHAKRRIVIDSILVFFCVVLVVATHRLLSAIRYQAAHDRLTGLPNRAQFESHLRQAVNVALQGGSPIALLFVDLDGFKKVNDTLGHHAGDELLCRVAERLRQSAGSPIAVARMGGDEFAVLVPDAERRAVAEHVQQDLLAGMNMDGIQIHVGASIGVARCPLDANSADTLLGSADIAMYEAKRADGDAVRYFTADMAERFSTRAALERELAGAAARGELQLYYQPQVSVASGSISGLEALLRWQHPQRGMVSPADFIPIAEDSGLIRTIGAWVLDEACRQCAEWQHAHGLSVRVAVNVSAAQFAEGDFVTSVSDSLTRHALPAGQLELEVTESIGVGDLDAVVEQLRQLRALGVHIALDDFGTGYSSLHYLDRLPLDCLKIDRAFVQRLDVSAPGDSLLHKIQLVAASFGLETVVEGVETIEQLRAIDSLRCTIVQGFVHAPPVPAGEVPETLTRIVAESGRGDDELNRAA